MTLATIRLKVDAVDEQIVALLEERFRLVLELKSRKPTLEDPAREKEILNRISSEYVQNIYREIFKNSKKILLDAGYN